MLQTFQTTSKELLGRGSILSDAAGVDAGAGCTGAVGAIAGADDVALVSVTCSVADL